VHAGEDFSLRARGKAALGRSWPPTGSWEIRPTGMTPEAYGNVDDGNGYTGTCRGNADTAKPLPKVARAIFLSKPVAHPEPRDALA